MWKLFDSLNKNIKSMNDSKYFAGLVMIMLNIGSKYITIKFSPSQEAYMKMILSRQLLIFSIGWMATRDIYMSLIITAVFVILADFLLNEQSSFCILPSSFKKLHKIMDLDGDGKISEEEIAKSIKILQKAHKHNQEVKLEKAKEKFNNMKY